MAKGLSSCGMPSVDHGLSSYGTWTQLLLSMWDIPGLVIEPLSPAFVDRFLTTGPPESLHCVFVFVFFLIYLFTYLAVLALSCGIQDLWSSLRHAGFFLLKREGSLVIALSISNCSLACELLVSTGQGSSPGPLHWECRVLTASAPGKLLFMVLVAFSWWLVMLSIFACVCWLAVCLWKNVYWGSHYFFF